MVEADLLRSLALSHPGEWLPVTTGESGAAVFRAADGSRYAKCVPHEARESLVRERDRVVWLDDQIVPGPRVLEWSDGDDHTHLVTSAVHGVPADRVPAPELWRAWPSIAEHVRRLHTLPATACPFGRELEAMFALAGDVVARGAVNPEFLPVEQQLTPPAELLTRLTGELDVRLAQEPADLVSCHGDLCLPNIILDPVTLNVTGFIDLGRLGRADRHADLALLFASAREIWPDPVRAAAAEEAFAHAYGQPPDAGRLRFYLHLDPLTWG